MATGGSNQPFRIVVGADYNLSIDQLKKDIHHILNRLPKTSRSIVVRANMNDVTGLQHDLTNISKKLNLTINQIALTANQQTISNLKTSLEQGLQTAGGIGVHVTARQNNILSLGAEIERGLLQAGGVNVPLAVGQQSLSSLTATVAQALSQINPNDRTVHVITDGNAVEQEIRAVLQRVSQTPLDIHVNLIGLPQNNRRGNTRLPGERRASRQLKRAMIQFDENYFKESDPRLNEPGVSQEDVRNLARYRAEYEQALRTFQQMRPVFHQVNGQNTDEYILNTPALMDAAGRVVDASDAYKTAFDKIFKIQRAAQKETIDTTAAFKKQNTALTQAYQLRDQLGQYRGSGDAQSILSNLNTSIENFLNSGGSIQDFDAFNQRVQQLRREFLGLEQPIDDTDQRLQRMLNNRTGFALLALAIQLVRRAIVAVYKNVVELDAAMTELRKVTDETDETYDRFLEDAAERAQTLGATLKDVVSASADFARIGYNLQEASKLADAAIVYKNVGDGIENISESSESIISTMQAFEIAAEDAMTIVDKFNITGNRFAISSGGVGDSLMNSAAALASANNTLEESIALITAANTTIQNPEKVGTTLKTVSMFLRAAKTEAEEAGESTEGMASSVSELRKEILSLTGNRVDLMINDTEFKSTYQILKELSVVWDELSDISQANILEMIGGKRNANVVAALIKNFEIAEKSLETSLNASGSALAENAKYLDSIRGKLDLLNASWQELSSNLLENDVLKVALDALRQLINFLNEADESTNGLSSKFLLVASALLVVEQGVRSLSEDGSLILWLRNVVANFLQLEAATTLTTGALLGTVAAFAAVATVVVAAGVAIVKWYQNTYPSVEKMRTTLAELTQESSNLQDAFNENRKRIDELRDAANKGGLNIVEQEELDRLEKQNGLLKNELAYLKSLSELTKNEIIADTVQQWNSQVLRRTGTMQNTVLERLNQDIQYARDLLQQRNQAILAGKESEVRKLDRKIAKQREIIADSMGPLEGIIDDAEYQFGDNLTEDQIALNRILDTVSALKSEIAAINSDTYEEVSGFDKILNASKYSNAVAELKRLSNDGTLSVEKIKEKYSAGILIGGTELVDLLNELEQAGYVDLGDTSSLEVIVDKFADTAETLIEATNDYTGAYDELSALADKKSVFADLKEELASGQLSNKMLDELVEHNSAMSEIIIKYRVGLATAQDVYDEYERLYKKDEDAFLTNYRLKIGLSQEYFEQNIKGSASWAKVLGEYYTADYKNYHELADGKLEIDKLLISKLGKAWQSYYTKVAAVQNAYLALDAQPEWERMHVNDVASGKDSYSKYVEREAANQLSEAEYKEYQKALEMARLLDTLDSELKDIELNLPETSDGKNSDPDYDEIYKSLVKQKELVEQNSERLSRMTGDFSAEQIKMWSNLRNVIIQKMGEVADKESERYHYLEDMLWEVNDAIEEIYDNQADAIQSVIDITREMIEEEYQDSIEAIEKQTDAYNDLIEAKKKALRVDKEANDYNKKVAEKTKEIAKLQSRIALLSLDDSRKAQAEKASLEEELAKLQSDLADLQAERGLELTEDALDESADKFEKAKDKEVEALEAILDDEARLYKETIQKIGNMENSFYQQLEKWAKEHGKDIRELAKDWDVAKNAKKGYTDLDAALSGIAGNKDSLGSLTQDGSYGQIGSGLNSATGGSSASGNPYKIPSGDYYYIGSEGEDVAWIQWHLIKGGFLETADGNPTWQYWNKTAEAVEAFQRKHNLKMIDGKVGPETLTKMKALKYHTGGVVGGHGSLRDNELVSILEKNEIVMANGHKMNLSSLFDNLRSTIGELVSGNLMNNMNRMRAVAPAGGNTIAPEINVTIQHNGEMSDADAKKYGSMVGDEALKKLHSAFVKRGL